MQEASGKIRLEWETLTEIQFNNRCEGCTDLFFIGEVVGLLSLNEKKLRFHYSCLNQLGMVIVAFIETTEDAMEGVAIERRN